MFAVQLGLRLRRLCQRNGNFTIMCVCGGGVVMKLLG